MHERKRISLSAAIDEIMHRLHTNKFFLENTALKLYVDGSFDDIYFYCSYSYFYSYTYSLLIFSSSKGE